MVVASSALALATMLGSTSKVTSLATSAGVGSSLGAKPLPCFRASISSAFTWSTMRSNSSCNSALLLDVDAAREHQIDGAIELHLGVGQLPFAIVGLAFGVGVFHLLDEQANAFLLQGQRRRLVGRGSLRLGRRQCRRSGLRRLAGGSPLGLRGIAACQ